VDSARVDPFQVNDVRNLHQVGPSGYCQPKVLSRLVNVAGIYYFGDTASKEIDGEPHTASSFGLWILYDHGGFLRLGVLDRLTFHPSKSSVARPVGPESLANQENGSGLRQQRLRMRFRPGGTLVELCSCVLANVFQ